MRIITSSIFFIGRSGKILFGREKNKDYMLCPPGGKQEPGELIVDCALRELKEETGLKVKGLHQVGMVEFFKKNHWLIFGFLSNDFIGEPKIVEPEKCKGWEWHSLTTVVERDDLDPIARTLIERFFHVRSRSEENANYVRTCPRDRVRS